MSNVYGADGAVIDDEPVLTDAVFDESSDEAKAVAAKIEDEVAAEKATETTVAVIEQTKDVALAEQWPHDYIMFENDKLEVRLPSEQALSAFSIGVSKYMPPEVQNDVVGMFIAQHMSPASYTHVFARMMNPDDPGYNNKTIGKLMSALSRAAIASRKAAAKQDDEPDEG